MRKKSSLIALTVVVFAGLVYLFAWSPVFEVKAISATGIPEGIRSEMIIEKSGVEIGEKLSRIDPRSIERSLEELSWVKSASIDRNWVNGEVLLNLTSRIPVGIYQGKAIDRSGTLFLIPGKTPPGLPVVSAASPELGLEAIDLFTHLPADIQGATISVSAANTNFISSWQMRDGGKLKITWGSSQDIDLKVSVLKALLDLPENKEITRVDLSAPHAPIVK